MKPWTKFALMALAALPAVTASAETQVETAEQAATKTDWGVTDGSVDGSVTLQVAKFDKSKGTLTGVDVTFDASMIASVQFENLDGTNAKIMGTDLDAFVLLTPPAGTSLLDVSLNPVYSVAKKSIPKYDGVLDYGGNSGRSYLDQLVTASEAHSIDAAYFEAFSGGASDKLTFSAGAFGIVTTTGGGNTDFKNKTDAGVKITVTYTYTPDPCSQANLDALAHSACEKVECIEGTPTAVTLSQAELDAAVAHSACEKVECIEGTPTAVALSQAELDAAVIHSVCEKVVCKNGIPTAVDLYTQTDKDNYAIDNKLDVCQSVACQGGVLVTVGQPCPPSCKFYTLTQGGWSNKAKRSLVVDIVNGYVVSAQNPIIIGNQINNYKFTTVDGIQQALPSSGTPRSIAGSSTNPKGGTTKNTFAGQLLAVTLDVVYNPGLQNNLLDSTKLAFYYPGLASFLASSGYTIDTNKDGKVSVGELLIRANTVFGAGNITSNKSECAALTSLLEAVTTSWDNGVESSSNIISCSTGVQAPPQ